MAAAKGRPPRRAAAANPGASYKAKSSGKKAAGGVTHRARDKTRGQGARVRSTFPCSLSSSFAYLTFRTSLPLTALQRSLQ